MHLANEQQPPRNTQPSSIRNQIPLPTEQRIIPKISRSEKKVATKASHHQRSTHNYCSYQNQQSAVQINPVQYKQAPVHVVKYNQGQNLLEGTNQSGNAFEKSCERRQQQWRRRLLYQRLRKIEKSYYLHSQDMFGFILPPKKSNKKGTVAHFVRSSEAFGHSYSFQPFFSHYCTDEELERATAQMYAFQAHCPEVVKFIMHRKLNLVQQQCSDKLQIVQPDKSATNDVSQTHNEGNILKHLSVPRGSAFVSIASCVDDCMSTPPQNSSGYNHSCFYSFSHL